MDYNQVFLQAVDDLKRQFQNGEITFKTESDLQSHLYANCLTLMKQNEFPKPYQIKTNFGLFSPRQKIDLVLGKGGVLVEIKYEPDNSILPPSRRPVVLPENVQHDQQKMKEYREKAPFAYFLFLDEDGQHMRRMKNYPWDTLTINGKQVFVLLQHA